MFRRFDPMVVFDLPQRGGAFVRPVASLDLYVDTTYGSDSRSGASWDKALITVQKALDILGTANGKLPGHRKASNSRIFVIGDVREHVVAPLGVYGCQIIGGFFGRPRHDTNNGVVSDGNSSEWRDTAVAGSAPLITLREQGWEIHNFLAVPPAGYAFVRFRREESATYPDASHGIVTGCRMINGSSTGYGIDDYGSGYNLEFRDNVFENLEYAYQSGNVGIAAPGRHKFINNDFSLNKHDLYANFYGVTIKGNLFRTVYNVTTHPNTVNCAATSDAGSATQKSYIIENYFADAAANVVIAKGYKPATGDVWRNYVTDTAAQIVAVPA